MPSMSRSLQGNFRGKNSWKLLKYSQSYDVVCQMALLGSHTAYIMTFGNVELLRRESYCWLSLLVKPILHDPCMLFLLYCL